MVPIVLSPCCHSTILSQCRVASSQAMPLTSCSVNDTNKSKVNEERIFILTHCFLLFQRIFLTGYGWRCDAPYCGHLTKFFIRQSGCANLTDSHACLQSSHGCKLNTVAWVVELTYLHVVVKCESLLRYSVKWNEATCFFSFLFFFNPLTCNTCRHKASNGGCKEAPYCKPRHVPLPTGRHRSQTAEKNSKAKEIREAAQSVSCYDFRATLQILI